MKRTTFGNHLTDTTDSNSSEQIGSPRLGVGGISKKKIRGGGTICYSYYCKWALKGRFTLHLQFCMHEKQKNGEKYRPPIHPSVWIFGNLNHYPLNLGAKCQGNEVHEPGWPANNIGYQRKSSELGVLPLGSFHVIKWLSTIPMKSKVPVVSQMQCRQAQRIIEDKYRYVKLCILAHTTLSCKSQS